MEGSDIMGIIIFTIIPLILILIENKKQIKTKTMEGNQVTQASEQGISNFVPQSLSEVGNKMKPTSPSIPTSLETITDIIDTHNSQVGNILNDITNIIGKFDPSLLEKLNTEIKGVEDKVNNGVLGKINNLLDTKSQLLGKLSTALDILKTVI